MEIDLADQNIVAKIYYRCLSTVLILHLLRYFKYLVDLVRPWSNDRESSKRVFLQHFFSFPKFPKGIKPIKFFYPIF